MYLPDLARLKVRPLPSRVSAVSYIGCRECVPALLQRIRKRSQRRKVTIRWSSGTDDQAKSGVLRRWFPKASCSSSDLSLESVIIKALILLLNFIPGSVQVCCNCTMKSICLMHDSSFPNCVSSQKLKSTLLSN